MYRCIRSLETVAGSTLYSLGERGEYFYIILEGSVEVRTPQVINFTGKKASPEAILSFIIDNHEDIIWEAIDRRKGPWIRDLLYEELKRLGVKVKVSKDPSQKDIVCFDKAKCHSVLNNAILAERTFLHHDVARRINP